jgi:hypothetical protein
MLERFRSLGVNLTAGHELAEALAYHTSNKPLFGFAKRHREHDPAVQTELNIALAHHAAEDSEKGVQLSLPDPKRIRENKFADLRSEFPVSISREF